MLNKWINKVLHQSFIKFYIVYCIILISTMMFSYQLSSVTTSKYFIDEIFVRLSIGMPIIFQFIIAYLAYTKNNQKLELRIVMLILLIYMMVCGVFSMYDLYFTIPNGPERLFASVVDVQFFFQLILICLVIVLVIFKHIEVRVILKMFQIIVANALIIAIAYLSITLFIDNYFVFGFFAFGNGFLLLETLIISFNPILMYVLSDIVNGKLFMKQV